jgi:hypothetical protein
MSNIILDSILKVKKRITISIIEIEIEITVNMLIVKKEENRLQLRKLE